jgi:hypothetical protein
MELFKQSYFGGRIQSMDVYPAPIARWQDVSFHTALNFVHDLRRSDDVL